MAAGPGDKAVIANGSGLSLRGDENLPKLESSESRTIFNIVKSTKLYTLKE